MSNWDKWTCGEKPPTSGWYAILFSWDAHEGIFPGAGYFDGDDWQETVPIGYFNGPHETEVGAKTWAYNHDVDI